MKKKQAKQSIDIEDYEKEIIEDFENGKFVSVDDAEEQMQMLKQAAANFIKRENRINIRISGADLNLARQIAAEEGLPYQTLLASVIHKFVTGRLVDKGR